MRGFEGIKEKCPIENDKGEARQQALDSDN